MSDVSELIEGLEKLTTVATGERISVPVKWVNEAISTLKAQEAEIERLNAIINTPENDDFISAISREAEHQRQRWPEEYDNSKTDWDWFWLIGYLSQKAASDVGKRKHHIITTCAALMNWHRNISQRVYFGKNIPDKISRASLGGEDG